LTYELSPERTVKLLQFRKRYSKSAAGYQHIEDDEDDFDPLYHQTHGHGHIDQESYDRFK
jgi:hypothetical protein